MDADTGWPEDVLGFWFGTLRPEQWFKRDDCVDQAIRDRFTDLYAAVASSPPSAGTLTPRQALAGTIVLDQFSRNIYRGSAKAFGSDDLALTLARAAVDLGYDRQLDGPSQRLFLFLPFEHSENLDDQRRSVALISALGDPELTRYAIAHLAIIERFGRFPHRNAALGRATTPEEAEFLTQPGSSF